MKTGRNRDTEYHDAEKNRWVDPNPSLSYFWFEYDGRCVMERHGKKRISPLAFENNPSDLLRAQQALQRLIWRIYKDTYSLSLTRLKCDKSEIDHFLSEDHLNQMISQDLCSANVAPYINAASISKSDDTFRNTRNMTTTDGNELDAVVIICPQHKPHIKFGIWSRSLCLYDNLATGSMIPLVYALKQLDKLGMLVFVWAHLICFDVSISFEER